jgi:hypothetical protein
MSSLAFNLDHARGNIEPILRNGKSLNDEAQDYDQVQEVVRPEHSALRAIHRKLCFSETFKLLTGYKFIRSPETPSSLHPPND